MFTGLISGIGRVVALQDHPDTGFLCTMDTPYPLAHPCLKLGDSMACSGVCLTLIHSTPVTEDTGYWQTRCTVLISPETLRCTRIGSWTPGTRINLELALRAGDPLGGHYVTGHVDTCTVLQRVLSQDGDCQEGGCITWEIATPTGYAPYIAPKGSITLDGVALTVNTVSDTAFQVMLIPHTLTHTSLQDAQPGTSLHLEVDPIARYVHHHMTIHHGH
jgi:riboflavin synthase